MRRASKTVRFRCGQPGCTEDGLYAYTNEREDGRRLMARYGGGKWRCTRHSGNESEVLSPTNLSRAVTLVSCSDPATPGHAYWRPEGSTEGGSGFAFGQGWKAWTKDFPVGTRLTVRVECALPSVVVVEGEVAK